MSIWEAKNYFTFWINAIQRQQQFIIKNNHLFYLSSCVSDVALKLKDQSLINRIIINMKQQNPLIFQESQQEPNPSKKASQHLQDYLNYFKEINGDLLSRNQLIEQLHSSGNIKYTDCSEDQYFKISVINYTSTFQIINIQVQYGHFLIPITLYNVQENSLAHYIETISSSVANIYAYQQDNKEEAIKCFLIKKQSFEESFIGAIKEYCIFKIAATLNIGPNLSKLCGFDLIVFSECIEFCMEKGLPLKNIDKIQNSKAKFQSLKRNLRILHQLNIVHMDIKPTNICLSQKYGHLLFIDFGFSNVIFQQIGSKSLVCFFGSLNYCSPQMLNIYNTGQSQLVDLYYNDVFAMKKVEKEILSKEKQEDGANKYELYQLSYEQKFTFRIQHKLHQFYKLARVKYLFFSASPLIKSKETMDIFLSKKKPLIKFTKTLPYSRLLEQFYDLLNERNQDTYSEDVLKNTLQNYVSFRYSHDGVESTSPQVIQRYSATLMGIHIKRRDIMNVNLNYIKEVGLKEMVSSPQIAKDLKKSVYYEKYVLFVNFKVRLSSFEEKIDAAKVMCQVLGITPIKSEFYDMEVSYLISSLRFLLQFYLVEDDRGCIKNLPIVLGNLVILEELTENEIIQIIGKIFSKKLSVTDYTNISIKLFLSLYWILQQSSSRYKMRSLTGVCANTLLKYLGEIKTECECQKNHIKAIKLFLFLDYGAATPQKLQIVEAFIEQKVPFIDKQIKKQIMLYLRTITMKLYFSGENGENRDKIINCIKLISEQDNIFKSQHFQYYHFKVFYFFFNTNNIRAMESIIKKFQTCLGSPILTSKYYISDLYYYQIYMYRNKNNPLFYQELIKVIKEDPQDMKKRIVFKIFHPYRLVSIDYSGLNTENRGLISNIHALLRQTFPLESIDFDVLYQRYGGYVKNFGQWCYNYVNIIGMIYPHDECTFKYLKRFEDKLKILPSLMSCYCCRQRFESCFLIVSAYRLQLEGHYEQIIKMHHQYAFRETILNQDQFKLLSILDILRFTIKVPALNHRIVESVELFCEWMKKKDAWFQSFNIIAKSTKAFEVTNRFFFMKGQFVDYFRIQEKLLQSILQYPSRQYIISYCSSHVEFLSKFAVSQDVLIEQFKRLKIVEQNKNPYFSLLGSIVLIFCSVIDATTPNKIIHFIYTNISKIITFAKCITRGHLFYYLAKRSAYLLFSKSSQSKQQKQRQLLFKIKMYIKSSIHDLSFSEFKRNYVNGKKIKSKCESINHFYQIKLQKYFSFIKRNKEEEDYNLLNFPYSSPFCIQTR